MNQIVTFGCRLNAYESEAVRARAIEAGLEGAIIFNTCAVTGEAVRQSRQAIRRARRANPAARIVVTGCAAQTEPESYAAMGEVDLVLGNAEKLVVALRGKQRQVFNQLDPDRPEAQVDTLVQQLKLCVDAQYGQLSEQQNPPARRAATTIVQN